MIYDCPYLNALGKIFEIKNLARSTVIFLCVLNNIPISSEIAT
jgi:hypothetical protein